MTKIKLNLPTGVSSEKNLINCFKGGDFTYVIFDANSVGAMGLPIILVSKYDNNRLVRIADTEEWNSVKGYLKEIISGTAKEYIKLPASIDADEAFYTQLTLPVASFDLLKKAYSNFIETSTNVEMISPAVPETLNDGDNVNQIEQINSQNNIVEPQAIKPDEVLNVPSEKAGNNVVMNPINAEQAVVGINDAIMAASPASNAEPKSDVVANPLLGDNILPNLDLQEKIEEPVVQNIEKVTDGNVEQNNNSVAVESIVPTKPAGETNKTALDFSAEKELLLKYVGEVFDKMVEKLKNN